jgi:hypothetical protein
MLVGHREAQLDGVADADVNFLENAPRYDEVAAPVARRPSASRRPRREGADSIDIHRSGTGFVDAAVAGNFAIDLAVGCAALDGVTGNSIPSLVDQYLIGRGAPQFASVGAIDPNIDLASTWKLNLNADWIANLGPLGDEWRFTANALLTEVQNGFIVVDLLTRKRHDRRRPPALQRERRRQLRHPADQRRPRPLARLRRRRRQGVGLRP